MVRMETACELVMLLNAEGDDAVTLAAGVDGTGTDEVNDPDAVEICVPDVLVTTDETAVDPTAVNVAVEFVAESLWPTTKGNKRAQCQNTSLEERMALAFKARQIKARQECRRVLSSKCEARFMLYVFYFWPVTYCTRVITRFHF